MSYFRENFKFLIKDSFIYGFAGALSRLSGLITMPILTRALSKSEYGILDLVLSFSIIFNSFIVFGQDSSIARFFFEKEKANDNNYQKIIATTGLMIQLICLIITIIFLSFSYEWIGLNLFDNDFSIMPYWKIALLSIPGSIFILYSTNLLKWTLNRVSYFILTILNIFLTIIFIIFFVYYLNLKISGALYASVVSNTLVGVIGIIINRKFISFNLFLKNPQYLKPMFYFSIPLVASAVITSFLPNLDKLFLINNLSPSDLAIYAVAKRFSSLLLIVTTSFTIAFGPFALSRWYDKAAPELFSRISTYYILLLVVITALISYFSSFLIPIIATQEYLVGNGIIPILSLTVLIQALIDFTYLGFSYKKKMHYIFLLLIINFFFSCLFLYYLVPIFGIYGAAISILLSELIKISLSYKLSKRLFFIPFEFKSIIFIFITFLPFIIINCTEQFISGYNLLKIILKTIFIIVFMILNYLKFIKPYYKNLFSFISKS